MSRKLNKKDLISRTAIRSNVESEIVEQVIEATLEEIYDALKQGESITLRNFGTFYIDTRRSGTVFKFNPAQRLRAMFGWSSTYKGEI